MNANLAERLSDGRIADNPTDELRQFEVELSAMEVCEPAEPNSTQENRGVLDGLKVIGLA
jgi:hypothetical protein